MSAGNENEQRHLLPLVDRLLARDYLPAELWADRGYYGEELLRQLQERQITPRISKPRKPNEPIPPGTPTRVVMRGKKKTIRPIDPLGRHRWPVERTNAWLLAFRRIAVRRDRKLANYLAFVLLAVILVLVRSF